MSGVMARLPAVAVAFAVAFIGAAALAQDSSPAGAAGATTDGASPSADCRSAAEAQLYDLVHDQTSVFLDPPPGSVPDGNVLKVTIEKPFDSALLYRALIVPDVHDGKPDDWSSRAKEARVLTADGDSKTTTINLAVPSDAGWWWPRWQFVIVACKPAASPSAVGYVGRFDTNVSARWPSIILATLVSAAFLLAAALASRGVRSGSSRARFTLDPVVISQDFDGRGSLSRLQILFFSILIAGLVAYILMRTGVLGDLSDDILWLMGIAGAGTATAKLVSVNRSRLSAENWSWLRLHDWIKDGSSGRRGRWRDLIVGGNEIDIYKLQMLIFSLVVAVALLSAGLTDLATFKIPTTILGVLGLSQVIYVGGKFAAEPSMEDLDRQLNQLRKLEQEFYDATAKAWASTPPAVRDLETAKVAAREKYDAFYKAAKEVLEMFNSTTGQDMTEDRIAPSIPK
jgi:hypothetical protein